MSIPEVPDWTQLIQLMGQYDSTPTLVAVDANGNIIAIMKGEYAGTLKTLATDADGRLLAVLTDPEDIAGVFRQMGLAELSARFDPIFAYDRRGDIVWWDDFESGFTKWETDIVASGAALEISAESSFRNAYSLKMTAGSDGMSDVGMAKDVAFTVLGKFGMVAAFTLASQTTKVTLGLYIFDGTAQWQGRVHYDSANSKITYQDDAGVEQDLATGVVLYEDDKCYHPLKFVVDGAAHEYMRLLLAGTEYDMSGLGLRTVADASAPRLALRVYHTGTAGQTPKIYLDNIVVTQNEPANA